MAQPVSSTNFLIHDANGQPQIIKVVQNNSKYTSTVGNNSPKVVRTSSGIIKTITPQDTYSEEEGVIRYKPHASTATKSNTFKVIDGVVSNFDEQYGDRMSSPSHNKQPIIVKQMDTSGGSSSGGMFQKRSLHETMTLDYRRRRADKLGKGLRHFSMKVCEKVRHKGTTTYNEVADELVQEFTGSVYKLNEQNYDQKNIRRRVYDALNVLMAMNIISKEKKEIRWIGLPATVSNPVNRQHGRARETRMDRIKQKTLILQKLILQQIALKNLAERNKAIEKQWGAPAKASAIRLPFLVVATSRDTMVNCSISNDKTQYMFNFNDKFEIQDEQHILKQLGMMMGLDKGDCSGSNLAKAKKLVPKSLEQFVVQMSRGTTNIPDLTAGPSSSQLDLDDSFSNLSSPHIEYLDESEMAQYDESDLASEGDLDLQQ